MIRLGFTGTQVGMSDSQENWIKGYLAGLGNSIQAAHHGDCIGADADFHLLCLRQDVFIVLHPPEDPKKRARCRGASYEHSERPYLERNRDIVNNCDILLACPQQTEEKLRSGTWSTIRYARKQLKKIYLIFPDGTVSYEDNTRLATQEHKT